MNEEQTGNRTGTVSAYGYTKTMNINAEAGNRAGNQTVLGKLMTEMIESRRVQELLMRLTGEKAGVHDAGEPGALERQGEEWEQA